MPKLFIITEDLPSGLNTISDLIRWGASQIMKTVGSQSPYNESYSLVAYKLCLKAIPDKLLNTNLTAKEKKDCFEVIKKRIEEEKPVPYIINRSVFANKSFYVDERVIIPRSPIQLLIIDKFKDYLNKPPKRVLDLCTGSGCIGIGTALAFSDSVVDLVDISEDALEVAKINVNQYKLDKRVNLIKSNLFENITETYDLILSNPPYVSNKEMEVMTSHEPDLALRSGEDGLNAVTIILAQASEYLTDSGMLFLEVAQDVKLMKNRFPGIKFNNIKNCPHVFSITKNELKKYSEC